MSRAPELFTSNSSHTFLAKALVSFSVLVYFFVIFMNSFGINLGAGGVTFKFFFELAIGRDD